MPAKVILDVKEVVELYVNQGRTIQQCADCFNISRRTMSIFLKENKIVQPEDKQAINRKRPSHFKVDIDKDTLYSLYIDQNLTVDEVATQLGTSHKVVVNRLNEYGITKTSERRFENARRKFLEKYPEGFKTDSIIQARQNTYFQKTGYHCPAANPNIQKKVALDYFQKTGYYHPLQNPEVITKRKNALCEHIGVESHTQQHYSEKTKQILLCKEVFIEYIQQIPIKTIKHLAKSLNVSESTIIRYAAKHQCVHLLKKFISTPELELTQFINSMGINTYRTRDILKDHKEIDIYCPEYKIGVEFNGLYWHSSLLKSKTYHFDKTVEASEKGIRLIHIYEHEWKDPVKKEILKSMLRIAFGKIEQKIYARNCVIKELSNKEARPFNNNNHLQGHKNAQITYGLFFQNKLVQLMSFSYYPKKGWWEIERGCPGSNNIVIGGVSKLFTHFIREKHPDKIFSYCDFNKFDGKGYEAIGMKFIGYTGPDMHWIIDGKVVNRSPSKHSQYKKEAEACLWGAGSKKYLWTK